MTTTELDQERVDAFQHRLMDVLNGGLLSLQVSVGHRTGLFDALATLPPSTSEQIAEATGLDERYVREWANALTVGGFLEYDPAARSYRLPPEHAASLTRAAGPGNLANLGQFISLLGNVEDDIVECFRHGGGVPYDRFPKFQALMAEMSAQVHDAALIDGELALVPGLLDRLREGIDVADIGCGQGHAINLMAQAFPNSRFVGIDFSEEGIAAARKEAAELGVTNATFEVKDAARLEEVDAYDFVCVFDAVHDQAHPDAMLAGIARALRPDGVFLCVEPAGSSNVEDNMTHPMAAMLYTVSTFHCMTVSLAYDGVGLGTMWGQQKAEELFREAGFTSVETLAIPEDPMNAYYVCRKA